MSCFAIANSYAGNLKDRKKLIGMLRVIGATKRKIVYLLFKNQYPQDTPQLSLVRGIAKTTDSSIMLTIVNLLAEKEEIYCAL